MQHLEEGTIHAWLDGGLSTTEAREVEQHIATCAECSAMVAEARGLVAGASRIVSSLDVVPGNVIPKTPASKGGGSLWRSLHLTPARAALAATLLIAVSSLLTVRHDTDNKIVMSTPRAAPAAAEANAPVAPPPVIQASPAPASAPVAAKSARSAVASNAVKDRPNELSEESVVADARAKADVAERRDTIVSKAVASADSQRAMRATAAPPAVAAAPSSAAGALPANAPQEEKRQLQRAAAGRFRLEEIVTTGAADRLARVAAPTCFEFVPPVTSPKLPQRFALQNLPGDTTRRVVRAINDSGRVDSAFTGSEWTRTTPNEFTVRFAANERPVTLQVRDGSGGAAASVAGTRFAAPANLNVSRVTCRP